MTTTLTLKHSMHASTYLVDMDTEDRCIVDPASREMSKSRLTGWYRYNLSDGLYESHQDHQGRTIRYWLVEDGEAREISRSEADAHRGSEI